MSTTANWLEDTTERLIPTSPGLINVRVGGRADGRPSAFRVLQHTAHLAVRENPAGVNAEIDAFLAALPGAA